MNWNKRRWKYTLIRQGWSVSPLLFNIFIEKAIKKFKTKIKDIDINKKQIPIIRFADDIAIVAENERKLDNMFRNVSITLKQVQLKINTKKK